MAQTLGCRQGSRDRAAPAANSGVPARSLQWVFAAAAAAQFQAGTRACAQHHVLRQIDLFYMYMTINKSQKGTHSHSHLIVWTSALQRCMASTMRVWQLCSREPTSCKRAAAYVSIHQRTSAAEGLSAVNQSPASAQRGALAPVQGRMKHMRLRRQPGK